MSVRGLDNNERAALLIGECQRAATDTMIAGPGGLAEEVERRGIIPRIAALAAACRAHAIPVIHAIKIGRADGGGTFSNALIAAVSRKSRLGPDRLLRTAIHPLLTPAEDDYVVPRLHGFSSFHGTELESILRALKVETIILVGVSTDLNLPGTSLEAVNRGFVVVLPEDCTAGSRPEVHRFQIAEMLRLLTTVTTAEDVHQVLKRKSA